MKKIRRIILLALVLTALVACFAVSASAAEIIASGTCGGEGDGTNLTWTLDREGVLTISGQGSVKTGAHAYNVTLTPWNAYRAQIKHVILEEGVVNVGAFSFYTCELDSIKLPSTLKTFDLGAVGYVKEIFVEGNGKFQTIDGVLFEMVEVTDANGATSKKPQKLVRYPSLAEETKYVVPSGIVEFDDYAFCYSKNLTEVVLQPGTTKISSRMFMYCTNLEEILLPSSVTQIGSNAFASCTNLKEIELPGKVKIIGSGAFSYCTSLKKINIPDGITNIDVDVFFSCSGLEEVTIPNSVTKIGNSAFFECSALQTVVIPDSVQTIGTYAFYDFREGKMPDLYFEGNAPAAASSSESRPSFKNSATLYYRPGTTGWTDSEAYDVEAGTWNGYKLAVWDMPILEAIEVSMDSELLLWLKFHLPEDLVKDDNAYAVITADKKDGLKETVIPMAEIRAKGTDKNGRYVIEQGMAAPEMGRDVSVSFVDGYGRNVRLSDYVSGKTADTATRAVEDYAVLALENGTAGQRNLNKALLTYGGYAQLYFDVDTVAPVYNTLLKLGFGVPSLREITADTITQELTSDGASLVTPTTQQAFLDSAIYHRVYFTLNEGVSVNDLRFTLTKRNKAGEYTEEVAPVYESSKGRYYVQIDGIASPLLDYMYNIEITDSSGNVQNVATSVAAYLKLGISKSTNISQINMFKAMYHYNQVANTYFGF